MKRTWKLGCALALAMLLAAGCTPSGTGGSGGAPATPKGGQLEGVTWVLNTYAENGAEKSVPASATADAAFAAGKISGRVVNSYSGGYTLSSGGAIKFGPIASTEMAGPPELMALESAYFANLAKVASYYSQGGELKMYGADGSTLLTFGRSEVSLIGNWQVTGYNNGKQAVVSVIGTAPIDASFQSDNVVTGTTGTGTYTGAYELQSTGQISIGPLSTTPLSGAPEVKAQEVAFLAAMESARTYTLSGAQAELRDAKGALAVTMIKQKQ